MALVETGIMTDIKLGNTDVQLVLQGGNVIWERIHDYSLDYLTFEVVGTDPGEIWFNHYYTGTPTEELDVYFSKNNGPWTSYSAATTAEKSVVAGDRIRFKGTNDTYSFKVPQPGGYNRVFSYSLDIQSSEYIVYGNIMSLLFGDNFVGETVLTWKNWNCFHAMFSHRRCVDARNLVLPATVLSEGCYIEMFMGSKITVAPELPATVLADSCYLLMFSDCTYLNYVKCLATDISASSCTEHWIEGVPQTGTFVKSPNMSGWTTGISGIPSGWTVIDAI